MIFTVFQWNFDAERQLLIGALLITQNLDYGRTFFKTTDLTLHDVLPNLAYYHPLYPQNKYQIYFHQ